jgi:hypothetical protein
MYSLDTQKRSRMTRSIRGYNLRLGAARIPDGARPLSPFANVSRNRNEILDPVDSKHRRPTCSSRTRSRRRGPRYREQDRARSSTLVNTREPDHRTREHYLNLGTSYWIEDAVAIGLRASIFAQQISGESMTTGSRSLFVTARLVLE